MSKELATIFDQFNRQFLGFDNLFERMLRAEGSNLLNGANVGYPPYNIRKVDDNHYIIELAVAGFGKNDIDLTLEGNTLTVSGKFESKAPDFGYIWKGIAERAFQRTFTLSDSVKIQDAELLNGMLRVFLENVIPESQKKKKIDIKEKSGKDKQLLVE